MTTHSTNGGMFARVLATHSITGDSWMVEEFDGEITLSTEEPTALDPTGAIELAAALIAITSATQTDEENQRRAFSYADTIAHLLCREVKRYRHTRIRYGEESDDDQEG